MHKLSSLRQHLNQMPGGYKIEADDLLTFVDEGSIQYHQGGNENFLHQYTGQIIITDFSGNADLLMFWVLQWMKIHMPELNGEQFKFEIDVLNHESVDVSISLELKEAVMVEQCPNGIKFHHCDEPNSQPEFIETSFVITTPDGEPIMVDDCHELRGENRTLYVNDEEQA